MANYLIQDTTLTGIAEAIRSKTGGTDPILVADMAAKIESISGGGGSLPAGAYWKSTGIAPPNKYYQSYFTLNGELYCATVSFTGNGNINSLYKYSNDAWVAVSTETQLSGMTPLCEKIEYNNRVHIMGGDSKTHYIFDGTGAPARAADLPNLVSNSAICVCGGKMYAYSYYDGGMYVWDEVSDTWTLEATVGSKYSYYYLAVIGGNIYAARNQNVYIYEGGTFVQKGTLLKSNSTKFRVIGNYIYYVYGTLSNTPYTITRYDVATDTNTSLGYLPNDGVINGLIEYNGQPFYWFGDNTDGFNSMLLYEVTE